MAILRGGTKVQGDETVNGDSIVTRNETVDGNLLVKGNVTALYGVNNLASISWEHLSEIVYPKDWFKVGDEKTISIDGINYIAQIYGFHHDNMVGGGKARITFGLKGLYPPEKKHQNSLTNAGGWESSLIRDYLKDDVYNKLPADLRNAIKLVYKPTANGGQSGASIVNSEDKLFLFSEVEVGGASEASHAGEGTKYSFFSNDSSRKKGSAWWLRSPSFSDTEYFCMVGSKGSFGHNFSLTAYGISFGFCV